MRRDKINDRADRPKEVGDKTVKVKEAEIESRRLSKDARKCN